MRAQWSDCRWIVAGLLACGDSGGTGTDASGTDATGMATSGTTGATTTASSDPTTGATGSTDTVGPACDVGPWPDDVAAPWVASRLPGGVPIDSGGNASITRDGRLIAYASTSEPTGDPIGSFLFDVFVYDAACDTVTKVPFVPPMGSPTEAFVTAIAAEGATVGYATRNGEGKAEVYAFDLGSDASEPISVDSQGALANMVSLGPSVSGDGRLVAFFSTAPLVAGDTNGSSDIYLRDRASATTQRVSVGVGGAEPDGACENPVISADGRVVAFEGYASNLVDTAVPIAPQIYVRDLAAGTTEVVSLTTMGMAKGAALRPSLSADGRFVAFHAAAPLVDDDTNNVPDAYVYDRMTKVLERVSLDGSGAQLDKPASFARVSDDGNKVVFLTGLISIGGSDSQVQIRDRVAGTLTRLSENAGGEAADHDVVNPALSGDGRWAIFETQAQNLIEMQTHAWNIFATATP